MKRAHVHFCPTVTSARLENSTFSYLAPCISLHKIVVRRVCYAGYVPVDTDGQGCRQRKWWRWGYQQRLEARTGIRSYGPRGIIFGGLREVDARLCVGQHHWRLKSYTAIYRDGSASARTATRLNLTTAYDEEQQHVSSPTLRSEHNFSVFLMVIRVQQARGCRQPDGSKTDLALPHSANALCCLPSDSCIDIVRAATAH